MKLNEIEICGFKSVSGEGQTIPIFDDVTVFIGANGVGKSNTASFFQMLCYAMSGSLQTYIAENGFADAFLHYGSKATESIKVKLMFSSLGSNNTYEFNLVPASGDTLIYTKETISFQREGVRNPFVYSMEPGKKESQLYMERKGQYADTIKVFINILKGCQYFQFHDTTKDSKIRKHGYINDNRYLRSNAGNLAAFLYGMKNSPDGEKYYRRIVRYIRQVMPQFGDFIMEPSVTNPDYIALDWKEANSDYIFGVNQISDGALRFMALATLLLQPKSSMPPFIIIDEPELGLHPTAISILAGLIKTAGKQSQIVLATQSTRLLDEFSPDNVVVIERDEIKRTSVYKHLSAEMLAQWEAEYTMSELWEKNVLGGKP